MKINFEHERNLRIGALQISAGDTWNYFSNELHNEVLDIDTSLFEPLFWDLCSVCTKHEGLTAEQYLLHPTRVALIALKYCNNLVIEDVINLALAHNVIEISDIPKRKIHQLVGERIYSWVETLTIDRAQRWDKFYLQEYYQKIGKLDQVPRLIKVCDKFDNLFFLEDNPSSSMHQ